MEKGEVACSQIRVKITMQIVPRTPIFCFELEGGAKVWALETRSNMEEAVLYLVGAFGSL